MRQVRLLASAGVGTLVLSLLALFPARVALPVLGVPAGTARGVTGTVWHGAAQRITVGGLAFGPLSWSVRPARLFLGQLAAGIEATVPDGFVNATVGVSAGGTVAVRDLAAAAPLSWLAPAAGAAGGQLTARFDQLTLTGGRVATAVGNLELVGVVLPIPNAPRLAPGSYALTFAADKLGPDEPLTGALKDAGGPLEVAGKVIVTPPRSYEINGTAKARPEAPADLRNALQMLGPATPDGGHELSIAGSF
jgi:hypothetical protein